MSTHRLLLAVFFIVVVAPSQSAAPAIQITGDIKQPLSLSAEDLGKMIRATLPTTNKGVETVYEGVWLHDILNRAGVPMGNELRGKALASYVVAEAEDGYQVVFSVAELNPAFTDSKVLLADTANGKPLVGTQGRFRLVVGTDKLGARSVRMLTRINVVRLAK